MSEDNNTEKQEQIWISTGCDLLDTNLGGGKGLGIPAGKIINIVGDKSAGKTFLAWEIIAATYNRYKKKLKMMYDDAEYGNTFSPEQLAELYHLSISEDEIIHSKTVQRWEYNYKKFLRSIKAGEFGIYVMDSLDGLTSDEAQKRGEKRFSTMDKGEEFKEGSYQMEAAKFLSQEFFKGITEDTNGKNVLLIIISQVRENIDPYSYEKYRRNGGKAMDFFCYGVLWLATINKMERKGRAVGVYVRERTTKLKAPRPYRECEFTLLFDYGIDNIGTNCDWVFGFRTEKGELRESLTASWSSAADGPKQNINTVKRFLKDQGFWDKFAEEVNPKPKMIELMDWIKDHCQKEFEETFGKQFTREEMIQYIEENKLQAELTRRALEKWEAIEEEIKIKRSSKY